MEALATQQRLTAAHVDEVLSRLRGSTGEQPRPALVPGGAA